MAVKEFTDETLEAIKAQGGVTPEVPTEVPPDIVPEITDPVPPGDTPDIEFQDIKPGESPEVPPVEGKVEEPLVAKTLEEAGFNTKEIEDRVIKDGTISDELVSDLKEKLDPTLVDQYVRAWKAELELAKVKAEVKDPDPNLIARNEAQTKLNKFIYDSVGGQTNFDAMAGVLKEKMSGPELETINAKLRSTDQGLVQEGIKDAVSKYKQATGRVGDSLMQGDPGGAGDETFQFLSKDEYHVVMKGEKYKTDPIFKKKIDDTRLKSRKLDQSTTMPGQYFNVREGRMYAI